MARRIDRAKIAGFWISVKERIGGAVRVEPRANQILLLLLEGLGAVQRRTKTDEGRAGISGQPARKVIPEFAEFEPLIGHDRNHSGAAVGTLDLDAVSRRIEDARAVDDG